MLNDPIVEEVREIRRLHAKRFNYDLEAIVQDLKRQERESNQRFVTFPPRRLAPVTATNTGVRNKAGGRPARG